MAGVWHFLGREVEALRARIRTPALLTHLLIVAAFGVFFPWKRPTVFLDPVVIAAYACFGVLFAGPAVAQAFAAERPQSIGEASARILVGAAYGEAMTIAIVSAAFLTVFLTHRYAFAPDLDTLIRAGILGIAGSLAMAAVAGWLALRVSAAGARRVLRLVLLVLLALFFFRAGSLPEIAGEAALVSAAIAAAAFYALQRAL